MFNYCFISVSDYILVFFMVFVGFWESSVRNVVAACYIGALGSCLFNNVSFVSLTPSVNGFAELPATLVSELGCHVSIHLSELSLKYI